MPSAADVIQALRDKRHDDVKRFIKEQPALVNSVDSKTNYSLMKLAIMGTRPLDLIEFLVTQPEFDFSFINSENENNLDVLINEARVDIIETIINDPRIIFNKDQLSYQRVKDRLAEVQITLEKEQKKSPTSKSVERAQAKIANLDRLIPMLRDATIKYAFDKDDPAILLRLEKAGDNLDIPLQSSARSPMASTPNSAAKISDWFDDRFDQKHKATKQNAGNPNAFFELQQAKAKAGQVAAEHLTKQTETLGKKIAERNDRIQRSKPL